MIRFFRRFQTADRPLGQPAGRVLAASVVVASLLMSPSSKAHTGTPSEFWDQLVPVTFTDGSTANWLDPRFNVDDGYASWDEGFTPCPGKQASEDMRWDVRGIQEDGSVEPWAYGVLFFDAYHFQYCHNFPYHKSWGRYGPSAYYELRLRGAATGTIYLVAKTTGAFEPPRSPSNLQLVEVTSSAASLTWVDNASNETGQTLQRSDDGRTSWATVATLSADQTTYTNEGLTPGHTYWYRMRASNTYGDSDWSNELEVTPGCNLDTDCDGLNNSDETNHLFTNPNKPDTDGDGLLDPWEAPAKMGLEDIENHGFTSFTIPEFGDGTVSRNKAFGPFSGGGCELLDDDGRPVDQDADGDPDQLTCLNAPPDPLKKDVFLEVDWQDCAPEAGECPHGDPMHHAPDIDGLRLVIDEFNAAGINLRILVDEALAHTPNCDQAPAGAAFAHFGTEDTRTDARRLIARELGVRYVWSGHSSFADDLAAAEECWVFEGDFLLIGAGLLPIPGFDWTPYGDTRVGARDLLITLGPLWSCPGWIDAHLVQSPCYRGYVGGPRVDGGRDYRAISPGIFPTSIDKPNGENISLPYPIARLLGVKEQDGITHVWSRTLMHLLGHSLGLESDEDVGNDPHQPVTDEDGDGIKDVGPESFARWQGLQFAPPVNSGAELFEGFPNYEMLVAGDWDGDGVPEGEDNCPGVANPRDTSGLQADTDFDRVGDKCDDDADGDGLVEVNFASTGDGTTDLDTFPLDTDNDGIRNLSDSDDDGDGVLDLVDNCIVQANSDQADLDLDFIGDRCDDDASGDGILDFLAASSP